MMGTAQAWQAIADGRLAFPDIVLLPDSDPRQSTHAL
jgi:hypothetical protein